MKMRRSQYSVLSTQYLVLAALAAFAPSLCSLAAPPKVNFLFPAGGQRGTSVSVTASGEFSSWPATFWVDRPGLTVTAEKEKGKFHVEIAAEAAGTYWMRIANADGAAVLRPFVVGTLAEVAEIETNDAPDKAQAVSSNVVVNGKLQKSGDVDGYRLKLQKGETLVASLAANSVLGAPMDALLQVCELVPRSGTPQDFEAFVVAQSHDAVGLDPQLAFTVPQDGEYVVRVFAFPATPDSSIRFAGGDDYLYRLTLTTGPFIDHCFPLALPYEEAEVQLGGWNLTASATAIVPPNRPSAATLATPDGGQAWVWRPDAAGAVCVPRSAIQLAAGKELIAPTTISGRLAQPRQIDTYTLVGKKNEKLRIRAVAKASGFPTDAVLAIQDASGKTLAEADDTGRDDRDPQLDFTPPDDGHYTLTVRDLAGRGDLRLVYRLTVEPAAPDYSLNLASDSLAIEKGKTVEIPVSVLTRDGFQETVEIRAVGLPPGITAEPVKFVPASNPPPGDSEGARRGRRGGSATASAPVAKLVLQADGKLAVPGGTAIQIEGRTVSESPVVRTARFPLNLPLAGQHHAVWLTVK